MIAKQVLAILLISTSVQAQEYLYDLSFFSNSRMKGSWFYSKASYQSPSWIKNLRGKLPVTDSTYFTPGNALNLHYANGNNGSWNAIVTKPSWRGQTYFRPGIILSMKMLVASSATSVQELPSIKIGTSDTTLSASIHLDKHMKSYATKKWISVEIPLKDFQGLTYKDVSDLSTIQFLQRSKDGKEHSLFIDDIEIISSTNPKLAFGPPSISAVKGSLKHIDIQWAPVIDPAIKYVKVYRASDGKTFKPVGIQLPFFNRYADFVGEAGKTFHYKLSFVGFDYTESSLSSQASGTTRNMTDDEFLTMIQEACFRYYWEAAEKNSGLAKENIPGRHNMIATGASGFGIMALIAGTERKFITRTEAVIRFKKIVDFLERTETFHGAFSHFVDGPTRKVEPFFGMNDNGGDLVETSFLMQGLLAANSYFNKDDLVEKYIRDKIAQIWQRVEWNWYQRYPNSKYLYWHWSPDKEWVINHQLIGWNETMVTYLLAIASPTHPVPAGLYYSGWASQDTIAQQYRKNWGQTSDGSMYKNGNTYFGVPLPVSVSNGGPLFFIHYSYLGYDPNKLTDVYTNYFVNNRNIALINYRYCVENPGGYPGYGDSCWGLTAGDGPYHYSASEPVPRMDDGKMVPTGAVSSFPYTPVQSMKALKNFYNNYGHFLWGEYGFRDAFNLDKNWCSEIYMGLNQAPMVVMIENYRTKLLWNLFMKHEDIQSGLKKLSTTTP